MARCRELFPRCASCGNAGSVQTVALRLKINLFNTLLANILVSQNSPAVICIVTGTVISIVFALALLVIDAARSLIERKLKRQ